MLPAYLPHVSLAVLRLANLSAVFIRVVSPVISPASLAEGMSAKDESSSPTDPIPALRPHILRRRDNTTFVILLPPPTTFGVAYTYRSGILQCSQEVGVSSDTTYVLCRAGGP